MAIHATGLLIVYVVNIVLAIIGLYISIRISKEKKRPGGPVCDIGAIHTNCNAVLFSKYGKILGIPLEVFGITYFLILLLGYLIPFFAPPVVIIFWPLISTALFILTVGGFLFSIHLILVQKFILKDWCVWCIASALTSTLIFIASSIKILI